MKNYGYLYGTAAKRLPRYYRCLRKMLLCGVMRTSSGELAKLMGVTPSQVRADLVEFSGAGIQGYGYNVKKLYREISVKLGVGDKMTAVILGGERGACIELAKRMEGRGITVTAVFRLDPSPDEKIPEFSYSEMEMRLRSVPSKLAVIMEFSDPSNSEKEADMLISCGVKGIWNLTQEDLDLPVPTVNLPFGDIIMSLCCDIRSAEQQKKSSKKEGRQ